MLLQIPCGRVMQRGYRRVSKVMILFFGPPMAGINGWRRLCYLYLVNPVHGFWQRGYQLGIGGYHCVGNGVRFFSFASFVLRPFRRRHRHPTLQADSIPHFRTPLLLSPEPAYSADIPSSSSSSFETTKEKKRTMARERY